MKNLTEKIKDLSPRDIEEIKKRLKIKDLSRNISGLISTHLLSYPGMSLVISELTHDERNILNAAYKEKNGITFADLEKRLNLNTEKIEKCTKNLIGILLITVMKNRQKLSNKMDKIHLTPEIRNFLNPVENKFVYDYYKEIYKILDNKDTGKYKNISQSKKSSSSVIIESIFDAGGIITLEEFYNNLPSNTSPNILSDLINNKYISLYHDLTQSGKTLIFLDKKIFTELTINALNKSKKTVNIHNRYNLLINLLKTYDAVSTYGLFITKQNEFRKIDKKRLDDSQIKLADIDGNQLDTDKISQLCLYLLNIQNNLTIKDDSVIISLKNSQNLLDDPFEWLLHIMKKLHNIVNEVHLLNPPFEIPAYKDIVLILDFISRNRNYNYKYLEPVFFINSISQLSGDQFINIKNIRQHTKNTFSSCLRFLCIFGIIEIENSIIKFSDIGIRIAEKLKIANIQHTEESPEKLQPQKDIKKVYLDSNFTLITPKKDIPSDALYHILTHTEIIIDDVILHTKISRESILTSVKRGMTNNKFFYILKKYLKTEIPDTLNFLISEWLNQTIKLKIFNATILYTNHLSFIDKLAHSKIKNCIIKRISANYAVIDRKYIDKLVRMAKENDAVINLFDESEEN